MLPTAELVRDVYKNALSRLPELVQEVTRKQVREEMYKRWCELVEFKILSAATACDPFCTFHFSPSWAETDLVERLQQDLKNRGYVVEVDRVKRFVVIKGW